MSQQANTVNIQAFDRCAVPSCFHDARYGDYCNGHKRLPKKHVAFPGTYPAVPR